MLQAKERLNFNFLYTDMKQKAFNQKISIMQKINTTDGIGGLKQELKQIAFVNASVQKIKVFTQNTKHGKVIKTFYNFTICGAGLVLDNSLQIKYADKIFSIVDINPNHQGYRANYTSINCVNLS